MRMTDLLFLVLKAAKERLRIVKALVQGQWTHRQLQPPAPAATELLYLGPRTVITEAESRILKVKESQGRVVVQRCQDHPHLAL